MRTTLPIIRFLGRHSQKLADEGDIELQQKRSMEQQKMFLSSLRIAGEFEGWARGRGPRAEGKIRAAADFNRSSRGNEALIFLNRSLLMSAATCHELFHSFAIPLHNKPIRRGDAVERSVFFDTRDQRIVQTPRPLQHRSAAAAPAENRSFFYLTRRDVHFLFNLVCISNYHEIIFWHPKPQRAIAAFVLEKIQQRLIAREIFRGRSERGVEKFHFSYRCARRRNKDSFFSGRWNLRTSFCSYLHGKVPGSDTRVFLVDAGIRFEKRFFANVCGCQRARFGAATQRSHERLVHIRARCTPDFFGQMFQLSQRSNQVFAKLVGL
ncbi:MAG TPA: hypothetical protein VGI88_06095 [Verrucomicrobiae bacterium]